MTERLFNPVDAIWFNVDRPENLMVIEALVMLDGPVDRARFEDVVQRRVVDRYPVFRQLATRRRRGGLPRWCEATGFRLADHIREVTLPAPGDDRALQEYVAGFLAVPLRRDRPLWEMHLIDGWDQGSAVYVRLHHSLADGIALTRVLLSITDPTPEPGLSEDHQEAAGANLGAVARSAVRMIRHPAHPPRLHLLARARAGLSLTGKTIRILRKLLFTTNPASAVSAPVRAVKKVVWSPPIPLDSVKEVAKANGATVNDVLVAALAGSVRRYLDHHGDRAVDVPTMIPVNLRPLHLPLPIELGNRFALVLLTLPSGLSDPLERLAETKRQMDDIKGSPEALITFGLIHAIGLTGRRLSRTLVRFFAAKAAGVTTNVPGPREDRYLAGSRITGLLGWVPGSGDQTVGTCIFSYAGTVRVGFKTDADAVPDPGRLLDGFLAELDDLFAV